MKHGASAAATSWKRAGKGARKEATGDDDDDDDDGSSQDRWFNARFPVLLSRQKSHSRAIGVNPFRAAVSNRGFTARPNFDLTFLMNDPCARHAILLFAFLFLSPYRDRGLCREEDRAFESSLCTSFRKMRNVIALRNPLSNVPILFARYRHFSVFLRIIAM